MRPIEDTRRRWNILDGAIGLDLRQAVREGDGLDPCDDGLRSVCWKTFLLYGPLSQTTWPKKLAESRSAYVSLRDHFLRFINHPNDLHSSADPLADDETSPWSSLRQDEVSREEIFQDVTRCMQDNFFFREPATQKNLLDILFIYSKLNPDTGYRQGMHELLAPILWVVQQDAVDELTVTSSDRQKDGATFMLDVLDRKFVEHDAFSLFCAVMQTAKTYYEMGEGKDSSPIVARSHKIHDDFLAAVDPELALHLQVVGILPQIYSIRWIRLLFGREFEFKDVLRIWDILFAENLRLDVVDLTCVAMLLRIRWTLIEADYTSAITALTHFKLPNDTEEPRSLVCDALFLDRNRNAEAGSTLILRYSDRLPKDQKHDTHASRIRVDQTPSRSRTPLHRPSPTPPPALFSTPQKQLENLFQEVSGGIQRRSENWNVSKAVRGAIGEVRRNVNSLQTSHNRQSSVDAESSYQSGDKSDKVINGLEKRIRDLEQRNKALSNMLNNALQSLRSTKHSGPTEGVEEVFNISLAKIQFVSVYLADSEIPIPSDDPKPVDTPQIEVTQAGREEKDSMKSTHIDEPDPSNPAKTAQTNSPPEQSTLEVSERSSSSATILPILTTKSRTTARPSLNDSSFSFMLGENQHRSGFVSSVSDLPEQRRGSDSKPRPKTLWTEEQEKKNKKEKKPKDKEKERKDSRVEDDGFTMSSLTGGQKR